MPETNLQTSTLIRNSRVINKSPVYFGWVILFAGTVGMIMTSPGQTYAVSIFIEHFITDLGISRSLVSTLYTTGTLIGSFALPVVGRQIDRRGPRRMVVFISILFGLACIYMGFVNNAIMLGLGFTVIRMFGQGSLGLVSSNVINQWWVQRRGMIMGISGLLNSILGLGAFPNLINWLIPIYGWRSTYIILGVMVLLLMAPLGFALFRDKPEDFGLKPDGRSLERHTKHKPAVVFHEVHWTASEATRTFAFWVMALGIGAIAMLSTGLFFHMVSIFDDNGLASSVAASVYLPIAITTAVVNLGSGILAKRFPVRFLLTAALFLQALSLWMVQYLQGIEMAFLYGVIIGATMGLVRTVGSICWANYFGRRHLGSITGRSSTILIIGSALGPMPLGIARDLLGNYNLALTIFAVLPLILAVISMFAKQPIRFETQSLSD